MSVTNTVLDSIPGEEFFTKSLQCNIAFILGKKTIKQGRLIIFKRVHYYVQITLLNNKGIKETFEIPIPFTTEHYPHENLMYFDYRLVALAGNNDSVNDKLKQYRNGNTNPSQYYNKILEIQTNFQ